MDTKTAKISFTIETYLKVLADEERYLDSHAMRTVDTDAGEAVGTFADNPSEAEYYDILVRGDENIDDPYLEVEDINPSEFDAVESALMKIFECGCA